MGGNIQISSRLEKNMKCGEEYGSRNYSKEYNHRNRFF
jgi:hypothetical protein